MLSAGGVIDPPPGYLRRLADATHERGGLLIVDEAQTGFGRLGTILAAVVHGAATSV